MGMGLKNVHDVTGIPLKDLVRTTSWNQAIELGLGNELGKVQKGYTADLVVINPRSWKPSAVFVDGEKRI
jgi:N-acetylglucosamine-6-phosphate deacetylase